MANRVLRDWTNSDKIDLLSFHAEVFFTRLIMKVDDFGCFYSDTRLLKANLFPLKLDKVREADLTRWMAECQKAGLIVLYTHNQKKYLQINDFRQRLDKAKAKFPLPTENQLNNDFPEVGNDFPAETETNPKQNPKRKSFVVACATPTASESDYKELVKDLDGKELKVIWSGLKDFIDTHKPNFIEPYFDAWNLYAGFYKLSRAEIINDDRKKKFRTRIAEPGFDFIKVLEKIKLSDLLLGKTGKWRVSFDWILENQSNYIKILEGNYDN